MSVHSTVLCYKHDSNPKDLWRYHSYLVNHHNTKLLNEPAQDLASGENHFQLRVSALIQRIHIKMGKSTIIQRWQIDFLVFMLRLHGKCEFLKFSAESKTRDE